MTQDQETLLMVKGLIFGLPAEDQAACKKLADDIRALIKSAGPVIGPLSIALVGAELQELASE